MANHFTPEELAKDLGMDARELIAFCLRESIPIYKGKVDRSLLTAVMRSKGLAVRPLSPLLLTELGEAHASQGRPPHAENDALASWG